MASVVHLCVFTSVCYDTEYMYETKNLSVSSALQKSVSRSQVVNIQPHVIQPSTKAMRTLKKLQRKFKAEQLSDEDLEIPRL